MQKAICGKPLKTRFKTPSFFQKIAKVDHETSRVGEKYAGASLPSFFRCN